MTDERIKTLILKLRTRARDSEEIGNYDDAYDEAADVLELLSASKPAAKSCQTGWGDICHMAKHDGVVCPDDSCDIDDGIRAAPAQSAEPVAWCRRNTVLDWKGQLMNVAHMYPSPKGLKDPIALYATPQPSPTAVVLDERAAQSDTGNAEADRIINRLSSSDPDFDDCVDAAAFIRKLVVEHKGPDGFATWKDAAIAERMRRVKLEAATEEDCDTLRLAIGYIGSSDRTDRMEHVARLRAMLAATAQPAEQTAQSDDARRYQLCRESAIERGLFETGEEYDQMVDSSLRKKGKEVLTGRGNNYGKKVARDGSLYRAQPVEQTRALTGDALDAARYRVIRLAAYNYGVKNPSPFALDTAIDAALAAARPASGETE